MAEQFDSFSDEHVAFIEAQHMFFVATAAPEGRVNLSPKGQDSLRVLGPTEVVWLNLTGSGNETAAHVQAASRITLMWCAFAGPPLILRAYGTAEAVHPRDALWPRYAELIPPPAGRPPVLPCARRSGADLVRLCRAALRLQGAA